jgi:hypothetical protein
MKSQKELSGISETEFRQLILTYEIRKYYWERETDKAKEELAKGFLTVPILRYELRQIISGKLEVFNRETVSLWVNWLLNNGYIVQNPDSDKRNGKILLTLNTRYFIDFNQIDKKIRELIAKRQKFEFEKSKNAQKKSVTLSTATLDSYQ